MPVFVMLSTLGPQGSATLRENPERLRQVNADVESMGVKILTQYALLGQWDFINIIEAPDQATMAKVATTLAARGTLKTQTLSAIPVEEFIDVLGEGVGDGIL
jgi:uncharacterized protein with GYD domain